MMEIVYLDTIIGCYLPVYTQENEEAKTAFVRDLKGMLRDAPLFLTSSADQPMYYSLMEFRSQLGEYCISHNITSPPPPVKGNTAITTDSMTNHIGSSSRAASSIHVRVESFSLGTRAPPPPPLPSPAHGSIRVSSIGQQALRSSEILARLLST